MPNWQRTPPVSGMSIEEIKRRFKAGIANWRRKGRLRPEGLRELETVRDGPGLDKADRKRVIQAANLAIYALANGDRDDYCGSIDVIRATARLRGLSTNFIAAMCDGIADAAAEASGESRGTVDQVARTWLAEFYGPRSKVISIPGGKPK